MSNDTAPSGTTTDPADPAEAAATADAAAPTIRVLGSATPEEVAALVAVLSAVGGPEAAGDGDAHTRSAWSDPSWRLVGPSRTSGGWRASGLPR